MYTFFFLKTNLESSDVYLGEILVLLDQFFYILETKTILSGLVTGH